ncbi:MAG TPA: hypothetical protein VIJ22_06380, partial [Polyangiaceae bacterium]
MSPRVAALLGPVLALVGHAASAQTPPQMVVDRAVVRFLSPETGGTAHPRFVLERTLALEARLESMAENGGIGEGYQERDVRAAMEHDVAEQMLASLAEKLIADSPAEKRPGLGEVPRVEAQLGPALVERLGGRARVDEAAQAEHIDGSEVEALVHRAALAAWYLDRAVTPILHPSDEQLRDVYRTSAHPYRAQPYEQAREALGRWFVVERVRVAESAFLQSA